MEEGADKNLIHRLNAASNLNKVFALIVLLSLVTGAGTGYFLAQKNGGSLKNPASLKQTAKTPETDIRTFRDFAEGKIEKRPEGKNEDYAEGTHILVRDVGTSVALTSSVVDLTTYEGKKVKVYGETQKAIREGWLMDVGKVEVKN